MVDYQSGVDQSTPPVDPGSGDAKQSFLATKAGKLVVGIVALVVVLAAIGVAVFFFVFGGGLDSTSDIVTNPTPASASQNSSVTAEVPVNPEERSLASSFTFRNIFEPTVRRTYETTEALPGSGETTDTEATTSVPANTLFLQAIVSEDGSRKAVFIWNDQVYSVGEGEQVGTTPWKVLKINSDSVLMLYGDSQVTLSVGQGVGK